MIGSFLTRTLALLFGYIYPAYECYKTVEMNKPDIDQLRFWCQYWILVAGLTVCERIGDTFIGWIPMYGEAKLAFFIYLWFPRTKGTTYVYDSFFRPYVAKHEPEIDRNLLELRLRAGDMAVIYWRKFASYGQTRIYDILQYVASQSNPPPPVQRVPSTRRPTVGAQPQDGQPSSPASSEPHEESTDEAGHSHDSKAKGVPAILSEQKTTPTPPLVETAKSSTSSQVQVMQIDSTPPPPEAKEIPQPAPPKEIMMEEAVRVTRARSRRTRPPSLDRRDKGK